MKRSVTRVVVIAIGACAVVAGIGQMGSAAHSAAFPHVPAWTVEAPTALVSDGKSYGEFIVKFTGGSVRATLDEAGRGIGRRLEVVRQLALGATLVRADGKLPAAGARRLLAGLAATGDVAYAEPNRAVVPTDFNPTNISFPGPGGQWNLQGSEPGAIHASRAWDIADGEAVRVAVLDTGIVDHIALRQNIVPGHDFISDASAARDGDGRDADPSDLGTFGTCSDCTTEESSWHGTNVAGVIAGTANGEGKTIGVAFRSKIVPIRVVTGRCTERTGSSADIAEAITWTAGGDVPGVGNIVDPVRVINMSFGADGPCSPFIQAAIDFAHARRVVVVAAAGNTGVDASAHWPSNCDHVISVGAIGVDGTPAKAEHLGLVTNHGTPPFLDISAPGDGIRTPTGRGATVPESGTPKYSTSFGMTSAAAPHVAGVVALVLEQYPVLNPDEVLALLTTTARPLVDCSGCGAGALDATRALKHLTGPLTQAYGFVEQNTPVALTGNGAHSVAKVTTRVGRASVYPNVRVDLKYAGDPASLRISMSVELFGGTSRSYRLMKETTEENPYVPTDYVFLDRPDPADVYQAKSWTLHVTSAGGAPVPAGAELSGWHLWV